MSDVKPIKKRRMRLCEHCLLEDFITEVDCKNSKYGTIRLCEVCLELPMNEIKISDTLADVKWSKIHHEKYKFIA